MFYSAKEIPANEKDLPDDISRQNQFYLKQYLTEMFNPFLQPVYTERRKETGENQEEKARRGQW